MVGTELVNPDFAEYARICGALGIRVDRRDRLHDLLLQGNGRKQRIVPKPNPAAAIRAKSFLALQELEPALPLPMRA